MQGHSRCPPGSVWQPTGELVFFRFHPPDFRMSSLGSEPSQCPLGGTRQPTTPLLDDAAACGPWFSPETLLYYFLLCSGTQDGVQCL